MSRPSIGAAWRTVRDQFRAGGFATPELDAKLLAQRAFGRDALGLLAGEHDTAPEPGLDRLAILAERRLTGEPVARILGHREFYGLDFALNGATLVPRPETEMLVDLALAFIQARPDSMLLDLGTGTGCIPIATLANAPRARAMAVDLSAEALAMAGENAARHGVSDRLGLKHGSWFEPLPAGQKFALILSNPPYIETDIIAGLDRGVRDFDPLLALDGGPDGLAPYRIIAGEAMGWLKPDGMIAVEIGSGQGAAVSKLFADAGFAGVEVKNDLAGLDRVVIAHHC